MQLTDVPITPDAIFAANRAVGTVAFDAMFSEGTTRRRHVHEAGSLRVRFPTSDTDGLSAVLVNTAGGVAGGDSFDVSVETREGANLTVTTAAAEKIYRSQGLTSTINVSLRADARSRLAWLPQETILFDRALLARRFDIDLHEEASLLLAEITVFGRAAMDEQMLHGSYVDRWRVKRDGRLIFAETLRVDGNIGEKLTQTAIANGGVAIATVLAIPGNEQTAERMREATAAFAGEVGISAWNGFALARFCAKDAARLRGDVMKVLAQIDAKALPRLWLN